MHFWLKCRSLVGRRFAMNVSSMPAHHARVQDVCVLLGERSLEGRSLDERIIDERIMVTGDALWRSRGSDPMDNDPHVLFG